MVGAALGEELAIDVNPSLVSPATMLAALAAAWTPGRIAVRFDDDVAQALMDTPLEGTIPTEVLQRLPAWGLYIDCPGFGSGSGFFVTLDAGTVIAPGDQGYAEVDELLLAVVRGGDAGPPVGPELSMAAARGHDRRLPRRAGPADGSLRSELPGGSR